MRGINHKPRQTPADTPRLRPTRHNDSDMGEVDLSCVPHITRASGPAPLKTMRGTDVGWCVSGTLNTLARGFALSPDALQPESGTFTASSIPCHLLHQPHNHLLAVASSRTHARTHARRHSGPSSCVAHSLSVAGSPVWVCLCLWVCCPPRVPVIGSPSGRGW